MADFDPPFSSVGGVNRSPTTNEQSDGFSCGPADLTLFNRLFGRIEAELKAIQDEGGIAGSEEDDTTVLQAIQAMIAAATGGGDTSQFVLFSQAQARLPIFPEVTTNNGVIAVTSPGTGQVRIPAGAVILHRGIRTYTTVQVDLNTVASKTYHLRWSPTGGAAGTFVLKDLSDVAYNPTVAAETNQAFDSTYDDMLVARINTNASNVVTSITNLVNRNRLQYLGTVSKSVTRTTSSIGLFVCPFDSIPLNFARTCEIASLASRFGYTGVPSVVPEEAAISLSGTYTDNTGSAIASVDRYSLALVGTVDMNVLNTPLTQTLQASVVAIA